MTALPVDEPDDLSLDERVLAIIEKLTPTGDYRTLDVARDVLDYLRQHEAVLLDEWLDLVALRTITDHIGRRRRSDKARTLIAAHRGDSLRRVLDVREQIDDDFTLRPLGRMNRIDLRVAATFYLRRADANRARALRLRLLADALPDDTTTVDDLDPEIVRRILTDQP